MSMLRNYLAKRRIKKFLTAIPRTLTHDYGRADEYTVGQVKTTAKKLGYEDTELLEIAVAIYCKSEAAEVFGMNEALIKKYRGYPEQHRVNFDAATGAGGLDGSGTD